jgi:hypothetical protein
MVASRLTFGLWVFSGLGDNLKLFTLVLGGWDIPFSCLFISMVYLDRPEHGVKASTRAKSKIEYQVRGVTDFVLPLKGFTSCLSVAV